MVDRPLSVQGEGTVQPDSCERLAEGRERLGESMLDVRGTR